MQHQLLRVGNAVFGWHPLNVGFSYILHHNTNIRSLIASKYGMLQKKLIARAPFSSNHVVPQSRRNWLESLHQRQCHDWHRIPNRTHTT